MNTSVDQLGSKNALEKFIEEWKKHPISLSIVVIVVNMAFTYLYSVSKNDTITLLIIISTYVFSLAILAIIYYILYHKKNVLYSTAELINTEITKRRHILQENFTNIKIGELHEPYEEEIEELCLNLPTHPITQNLRTSVIIYEFLTHLQEDFGLDEESNILSDLALAKYFYKEKKYELSLKKINKAISKTNEKEDSDKTGKEDIGENVNYSNSVFKKYAISPGEIEFCKGLILKKLERVDESYKYFKMADEKSYEVAKCYLCTHHITSSKLNSGEIEKFIIKATKKCPSSISSKICLNRLSTAYYNKARLFSENNADFEDNIKKAVNIADETINKFDSWAAYYNIACDLSMMANKNIYWKDKNLETKEDFKKSILEYLKKSFSIKPELAIHTRKEIDLKWIKENYKDEFYSALGYAYDRINMV